jgi:hypothetical protein
MAMLTLLLLNAIDEDDTTELDELLDELIELEMLLLIEEMLDTLDLLLLNEEILLLESATELLLAVSPQFFRKVHELSLPGILCVHQFAL